MEKTEKARKVAGAAAPNNQPTTLGNLDKVTKINETIEYNPEEINAFLDLVYGAYYDAPYDDENPLIFYSRNAGPGFPRTPDAIERTLKRNRAYRWYFGTSTCTTGTYSPPGREPVTGPLNRKANFCRLHVVVLDDIGGKIPVDSLPEGLEPTYVIESSPGNYQYGFVLADPIDSYEHAAALVKLVYDSGYTDSGGALACKAVRLPCGVNGKEGPNKDFPVRLVDDTGPLWTPQSLLNVLEVPVQWEDVVNDPASVLRERINNRDLATEWLPFTHHEPTNGIVDPLLDWLAGKNLVVQDTGGSFVEVICPWQGHHTVRGPHDTTAGYSPLGRGDGNYAKKRGFHCFHDACQTAGRGPADFLEWCQERGAPDVPLHEPIPELMSRLVYISAEDKVFDMKTQALMPRAAVGVALPAKTEYLDTTKVEPVIKKVKQANLWLDSPYKLTAGGREFMPYSRAPLAISKITGDLRVNLFSLPEYSGAPPNTEDVDKFTSFLSYLIPNEGELTYFLDWLAAKVQSLEFRGNAIVMVAPVQGTGRTTLALMLSMLFGPRNTQTLPFEVLANGGSGGRFNEFVEKLLVVCNETSEITDYKQVRKVKEKLKDFIDTAAGPVTVDPKGQAKREVISCTSYLLLSNHVDALSLGPEDRRFYVISNTDTPRGPNYFVSLHAWIAADEWRDSVWNYLRSRPVDIAAMHAPAPLTQARETMTRAAESPWDSVIRVAMEVWGLPIINQRVVEELMHPMLKDAETVNLFTRRGLPARLPYSGTMKDAEGRSMRWRSLSRKTDKAAREALRNKTLATTDMEWMAMRSEVATRLESI